MRFLRFNSGLILAALAALAAPAAQAQGDAAASRAAGALLRPGDRIELRFPRDPELNGGATVDERGQVALPKLGILTVSSLSIAALQDTLRARYGEYLRLPEFEISVLRRVVVNGEVRSPNVYMVDVSTTLRDLIARAGGLTDAADRRKVTIVRGGERIAAESWDSTLGDDIDLRSGDEVFVGRKNWWVMNALPAVSTAVLVASLIISVSR